jgi:outer membrane protein OmpA-like peptidoglycan-associated protein
LATDGTFTVTLNVSKTLSASGTLIFDESTLGNYGIYTQTGGGARYAPFETFTPLTFAVPVVVAPTPTPTVTPTPAPVVTVKPKLKKEFATTFGFNSGSGKLSSSTNTNIKKRSADYRLAKTLTITVEAGMTTGTSSMAVMNLAKVRANSIKKLLVAQGIASNKIVIKTKVTNSGMKPNTKIVATP